MNCLVCLHPVDGFAYHPTCAEQLFGTRRALEIDIDRAKLMTFALAMVGRTTLSGAQEKLSLGYSPDRTRLVVATERAQFILKPQQGRFLEVPENEHVTMLLARGFGIDVPPFGLVRLTDGSLAYLVRRFDRVDGRKLRMEDFCQLGEKPPAEKYDGSAEFCVRLLQRFASEPPLDVRELFRRIVFAWWTGNGDLHLKNFSLLAEEGRQLLSPAYDLVNTRLLIPDDQMALPIGGKRERLKRRDFEALATYARIPERAATRVLHGFGLFLETALEILSRCLLSQPAKDDYAALLRERTTVLTG
jgi:serine/threonine-protein kinase HipA